MAITMMSMVALLSRVLELTWSPTVTVTSDLSQTESTKILPCTLLVTSVWVGPAVKLSIR